MLNKGILGIVMMTILGCSQSNIEKSQEAIHTNSSTQQEVIAPPAQTEPFVFVAHLEKLEEVGDAALYTGILNEKNGCLYINDRLIFVTGVGIEWKNEPFWIGNHHGEKFKLGDKVSVGGSETFFENRYDNSPDKTCKADKVWLTLSIDKPFI